MIRIPAGFGLDDASDAAVTCLREGCELHRMREPRKGGTDEAGTVCGLPEYALVHPFPAVGYAALLARSLCPSCWPQPSVWAVLLRRAHPDRPRLDMNSGSRFGPLNDSRIQPGVGNQSRGYR